ncbi:MAG: TetR/AcrR family transcriptional regulator [Anaerolineales bacterium]|nr:TetR/AcrR family transcriptional regulator [Anaerolineales bacterium]
MEKDDSQDTRLKIINAAIKMASIHGYLGATTKAIAKEAGVNEVTIFRLFGSKDNLFDESIERFGGPAVAPQIEAMFTGNLREDMVTAAKGFYKLLYERRALFKLALCESASIPSVAEGLARNPRVFRKTLARYLQKQMDKGVVKQENPEALAQAFLGMFVTYLISQFIFKEKIEPDISDDEMVSIFVDIFLNGIVM